MKNKNQNHGQAMIESVVAITFITAAVSGLFVVVYLSLMKTWMIHVAYETTICLAKDLPVHICRQKTHAQIQLLNFFSYPVKIEIWKNDSQSMAFLTLEYLPKRFIKAGQQLNLPLKAENL